MPAPAPPVAFVFGGGGRWGAAQVGMAAALVDAVPRPDLVVGTSIGAVNGAVLAREPGAAGVARLRTLWEQVAERGLLRDTVRDRVRTLRRTRVALHRSGELGELLEEVLGAQTRIEDLPVPFACVAACIETASARWFEAGPLVPALLASAAVPGIFEPFELDGRHYLDGGLVDSIPLGRAVRSGARTAFVLQVGRVEQPLSPPRNPAQVAQVAFEVARRHRFATFLEDLPPGVTVHVLPSGGTAPGPTELRRNLAYADRTGIAERIAAAEAAARRYLAAAVTEGP